MRACRACSGTDLVEVYDFGLMPLAGDYYHGIDAQRYPLQIDHCRSCGVLQVRTTVLHEVLFNEQYCYASSTVPALRTHFAALAQQIQQMAWKEDLRLLEVGSNDGVLLRELKALGISAKGIDASRNLVDVCHKEGLDARCFTFNSQTAGEMVSGGWGQPFDVVTCSNVFAHNEDPNDFLEGVKKVLIPDGKLIIEVHDSYELYSKLQWDCFYHEHSFYWSAEALCSILDRHGFTPWRVERPTMHGGAIRIIAHHTRKLQNIILPDRPDWALFGARIQRSIDVLRATLSRFSYCCLYSAPGRSATLLNAIKQHNIVVAFDGSPLRIGRNVPGQKIKISREEDFKEFAEVFNGYVLLGAWHLHNQLMAKLEPYKHHISGILTPLPNLTIE